jgi:hypothetical protein
MPCSHHRFCAFATAFLTLAAGTVATGSSPQQPPRKQGQAQSRPSATKRIPRIDDGLATTLFTLTNQRHPNDLLGLVKFTGDRTILFVTSNRTKIAHDNVEAIRADGRYNPPEDVRKDLVFVQCGDADFGEVWNCVRLNGHYP